MPAHKGPRVYYYISEKNGRFPYMYEVLSITLCKILYQSLSRGEKKPVTFRRPSCTCVRADYSRLGLIEKLGFCRSKAPLFTERYPRSRRKGYNRVHI